MLPLEATGIRFNLPSQVLFLGCRTILSQPDVLQGNLVFARHLPHHRTERKLIRFADDDSASLSKKWIRPQGTRRRLTPTISSGSQMPAGRSFLSLARQVLSVTVDAVPGVTDDVSVKHE
jgi:hypothetical protein